MSNLQSDIDYIKSMAESGGRAPMKNGAILFWAGLLYGGASIAQYLVALNILPASNSLSAAIWLGVTLVFLALVIFISRRNRHKGTAAGRAAGMAWAAIGFGIMVLMTSLSLVARAINDAHAAVFMITPVILVLYAIGWWVSAVVSGSNWLKTVGVGCFIAAPLVSLLAGRPEQLLANAVALFLFAMVPGLVLMRNAKG